MEEQNQTLKLDRSKDIEVLFNIFKNSDGLLEKDEFL